MYKWQGLYNLKPRKFGPFKRENTKNTKNTFNLKTRQIRQCTIYLLLVVSMARAFFAGTRLNNMINILKERWRYRALVQRIDRNTDRQNMTKTDRNLNNNR